MTFPKRYYLTHTEDPRYVEVELPKLVWNQVPVWYDTFRQRRIIAYIQLDHLESIIRWQSLVGRNYTRFLVFNKDELHESYTVTSKYCSQK